MQSYCSYLVASGEVANCNPLPPDQPPVPSRTCLTRECGPALRLDCGYYGINQQDCEARACCWDTTYHSVLTIPYCFYDSICSVENQQKIDCGYVGIKQKECVTKGCCWYPEHSATPWCFKPNNLGPTNQ
jgi:hypothetical protein